MESGASLVFLSFGAKEALPGKRAQANIALARRILEKNGLHGGLYILQKG